MQGALLFAVCQVIIWLQTNGQFLWPWFKKNPWILAISGIPVSFAYIYATRWLVEYFDGQLWPVRFVGFSIGIATFAVMTYLLMGEGITLKTLVSILLCFLIIYIQFFWK